MKNNFESFTFFKCIKCSILLFIFFVKFEGFDYRGEKGKIRNFLKFKRSRKLEGNNPPVGNRVIVFWSKRGEEGGRQYKRESNSCFIVVGGIEKRRWTRCKRSHQLGGKRLHSILFTSKRPHCGTTITTDRIPLPRGAFNLVTRNVAFYGQLFLPWPLVAFCENRPTVRSLKAGKSGARCAPSIIYLPFPQIFVNTRCP